MALNQSAFRDGSLGFVPQAGAFRSGALGITPPAHSFRDGSLGVLGALPPVYARRDGILGAYAQPGSVNSGVFGALPQSGAYKSGSLGGCTACGDAAASFGSSLPNMKRLALITAGAVAGYYGSQKMKMRVPGGPMVGAAIGAGAGYLLSTRL